MIKVNLDEETIQLGLEDHLLQVNRERMHARYKRLFRKDQLRKQALKWPGEISTAGGTIWAQASNATGQRVRNTQPDGGLIGLGISPFSSTRSRRALRSVLGIAESSAWV